jgi:hypothetical protein
MKKLLLSHRSFPLDGSSFLLSLEHCLLAESLYHSTPLSPGKESCSRTRILRKRREDDARLRSWNIIPYLEAVETFLCTSLINLKFISVAVVLNISQLNFIPKHEQVFHLNLHRGSTSLVQR